MMKGRKVWIVFLATVGALVFCAAGAFAATGNERIIFLHHSTGGVVWDNGVPGWFTAYNTANGTNFQIEELWFPQDAPYGPNNYPYDYWNIWVNHAGVTPYMDEPTLEILTQSYDVIVWKHCFPVSEIEADTGTPDITSDAKRQENYRLQYDALKTKMHSFPTKTFVVWTGAVHVQANISAEQATRMQAFVNWVKNTWDEPGDNIFLWDFYQLETEGGLYLLNSHAEAIDNSHPSAAFGATVAPLLCQTILNALNVTVTPTTTATPTTTTTPTTTLVPSTTLTPTGGGGGGGGGGGCTAQMVPSTALLAVPFLFLMRR